MLSTVYDLDEGCRTCKSFFNLRKSICSQQKNIYTYFSVLATVVESSNNTGFYFKRKR